MLRIWRKDTTLPADIYLFKVNNGNSRAMCEICSKLTIKTSGWNYWLRSDVFVAKFEEISYIFMVFPLLTWNKQMLVGGN